ncbi:MAG: WecB/TagA/CpsF family glycosyltransferase [candidate division Zixibacteria bacterium]|nr:WecB/TagA/CpsF family glycosyltransferase [candidate division Zixibacteria bacterium]
MKTDDFLNRIEKKNISLLGIPICVCDNEDAVDMLDEAVRLPSSYRAMIINVFCMNLSFEDPIYKQTVRDYHLRFSDGVGMYIAGRLLKNINIPNICGTDFGMLFFKRCAVKGYRIFLLGAKEGIAQKAAENLGRYLPGIDIVGSHHGYFGDEENDKVIQKINETGADVLIVCMGKPKEVNWIEEYHCKLNVRLVMPLGGFLDTWSGYKKRAPLWIRKIRSEWFYRMFQRPIPLWKRHLGGKFLFLIRTLKWKLTD